MGTPASSSATTACSWWTRTIFRRAQKADIALIRQVTNKPVRHLVITHWHFDHNNGTVAYKQAFPGLLVVSERETARFIDLNGTWWSRMNAASGSEKRNEFESQGVGARGCEGRCGAGAGWNR